MFRPSVSAIIAIKQKAKENSRTATVFYIRKTYYYKKVTYVFKVFHVPHVKSWTSGASIATSSQYCAANKPVL